MTGREWDPESESASVATVAGTVSEPAADPAVDESSQSVQIDLQEGFDGSAVAVLIDRGEVFAAESVQTVALTGFAETFTVQVAADVVEIELCVAGESVGAERVDLRDGLFVGLSIEHGAMTVIQTVTALGYG